MDQLFHGLPTRQFRKGQILIYEGDTLQELYYLQSGFVKAFDIRSSGDRRTIGIFTPSDAFPLISLLAGASNSRYFYECITDVDCQMLTKDEFQDRIRDNLEMGEELIKVTYQLNLELVARIETLSEQSARHKVVALLKYLVQKTGTQKAGKVQLQIPLTTQDIAELCNLTRETTTVQLTKLKKDGIISGRRNLLVDDDRLKRLAKV